LPMFFSHISSIRSTPSSAILGLNPFVRSVIAIAIRQVMTDAQNIGHLAEVSHQPR
jgi:hypothetical protein